MLVARFGCALDPSVAPGTSKHTRKSFVYRQSLIRWLGDGLLISDGEKWHTRRHLITPTFHFEVRRSPADAKGRTQGTHDPARSHTQKNAWGASTAAACAQILRQFAVIMNEHADVMVELLAKVADGKQTVDVFEYITRVALGASLAGPSGRPTAGDAPAVLTKAAARARPAGAGRYADIICETAMGVHLNGARDGRRRSTAQRAGRSPQGVVAAQGRSDGWAGHRECTDGRGAAQRAEKEHPYVSAVYQASRGILERAERPQYFIDSIYYNSAHGKRMVGIIKMLHGAPVRQSGPSCCQCQPRLTRAKQRHRDCLSVPWYHRGMCRFHGGRDQGPPHAIGSLGRHQGGVDSARRLPRHAPDRARQRESGADGQRHSRGSGQYVAACAGEGGGEGALLPLVRCLTLADHPVVALAAWRGRSPRRYQRSCLRAMYVRADSVNSPWGCGGCRGDG